MLTEGGGDDADRLRYGFRLTTARFPTTQEAEVLKETLDTERKHFEGDTAAATKATEVGESPVPKDLAPTELAAYTMVANMLLNLDEVVTKN
jgi:hypothetical protein